MKCIDKWSQFCVLISFELINLGVSVSEVVPEVGCEVFLWELYTYLRLLQSDLLPLQSSPFPIATTIGIYEFLSRLLKVMIIEAHTKTGA